MGYKNMIANEFQNCVMNAIGRLKGKRDRQPFHEALLSDEVLFWAKFERSFSTSFGQRTIEQVSKIVVEHHGAEQVQLQRVTTVRLDSRVDQAIQQHLDRLTSSGKSRSVDADSWRTLVNKLNSVERAGESVTHEVRSDLWWLKNGIENFVSIKTVKPNIDQTLAAKRDLLRLKLADMSRNSYFGLYYNPFGDERSSYRHNPPMKIFNFHEDESVLIGKDYWETLGRTGTYDEILSIAREVGVKTRMELESLRLPSTPD